MRPRGGGGTGAGRPLPHERQPLKGVRTGDHAVTFDKILMKDPTKQMKFSRLINHDMEPRLDGIARNWQRAGSGLYHDVAYATPSHGSF